MLKDLFVKPVAAKRVISALAVCVLLPFCVATPALAHHVMEAFPMKPSPFTGLLSGLLHPALGVDHLLFLMAIGLVGLRQQFRWVIGLLAIGLIGALLGLAWPNSLPGAEAWIGISLALEALVLLDRLPKELSGGQKQRVALGRAIAREPAVFLMDEPLSNLDAKLRGDTRRQIVDLQRSLGVTTVYVTHDQVEAMTMGHRIAVLNGGCLQQLGTPMELYQKPANLFVAQFIGSPPMNLLKVEVVSAEQVLLGGRRITLEPAAAGLLHNHLGKQLTAGLRPEKLRLAPATNRNLPAEVEQIEALGNEVLVAAVLQESGEKVQFRALPAAALQLGQVIHLEVDASGWSLFDADGLALGQVL